MVALMKTKTPKTLREWRDLRDLTQGELAAMAKIGVATVVRAERRKGWPTNPSVRRALEIALGVA